MDSGESGSMRSSSGGGDDQEFDSRGGGESSISSFLNPFFLPHHHQQNPNNSNNNTTTFFDHHQPFPQQSSNATTSHYISNNNNNNSDLFWSSGLRSQEPSYGKFGNLTPPSPSPQSLPQQQGPFLGTSPSSVRPLADPEAHASSRPSDQLSNVIKNPKKRTRASRRAPTTVLTTDTSNFRQMVQEFTGIPAGPFSGSPYSRRLDLFPTGLRPTGQLYPLRPSAHKILPSPFSSSSSSTPPTLLNPTMIDSIVPTTNIVGNSNTNNISYPTVPASRDHHQLLSLQQHHHRSSTINNPLQLGTMNFGSGFAASQVGSDDHNITRWRSSRSGETVVRDHHVDSNDGIRENENLVTFDGNSINSTATARGDSHHHHGHISGGGSSYNLNNSNSNNNNDDTLEKNVGVVSTAAGAEGNVASWICPPPHDNNNN